jgi:F-type H+-transporting ATPase subunit gamma
MAKTRQLKRRIIAANNTKRITKTLQMIATSKFARALQAATATKPYTEALFELVGELQSAAGEVDHPLLKAGNAKAAPLTLLITSDRGLAGPYNGSVLRVFSGYLKENPAARTGVIELVGKKGAAWLKFNKIAVTTQHTHIGDKPKYEDITKLAEEYIRRYAAGEVSSVRIAYMKFVSTSKQVPTVLQLLPFDPASLATAKKAAEPVGMGAEVQYEFSPPAAELLGELLPAALKAVLFQCFNEAIVSEHVARMVAMKSATDNAGKMSKAYARKYNRARQAQITTELMEVISGAAALN